MSETYGIEKKIQRIDAQIQRLEKEKIRMQKRLAEATKKSIADQEWDDEKAQRDFEDRMNQEGKELAYAETSNR